MFWLCEQARDRNLTKHEKRAPFLISKRNKTSYQFVFKIVSTNQFESFSNSGKLI